MKAAVYLGKEQLPVQEIAVPSLEDGEVLLKVGACNVCGTDRRTYRNGDKKIQPPRVLGHEFCGTVVESRSGADANVKVGDRVVQYIVLPCGECRYCKRGRSNLCLSRTTMAYHYDGAFAPYVRVPAPYVRNGSLFRVENDLPDDQMGLAEPLGCVINAHASRLNIGLEDTVAIIGAGPIGVMHAVVSRLQGAQRVWMLDVSQQRLDRASGFDVDGVVRVAQDGSHLEKMQDLTGGLGADVVIVACSVASAQADALEIAGKAARIEFFGGLPKSNPSATLNTNHLHYKECVVTGSYSEKMSDFQAAQALLQSGRFPADKIVTHHLPLERIEEAFPLMETGEALKVCIRPGD
ncbi:MAG: alcohol dehydrogenase [Roseibacillus sp.]|jgi:L-iditol 2-dehydrogenase|nr:alcohol dehydrogenase [Roseibacillus sp.]MBP36581.1 alcohol dehydrogenase [Roseibacillus sp.]MCP4732190.1 alcohol dehydrogenase catalytic domain-containing protein [Roseibacillus sp.]HJM64583.1 alcohol dehydrogenase catalytic domain-containing protein [Roseibacillus sp.]|tara:strand:+ start:10400 stop:11452 length:1053 start_codon:yes stop_codon:yes gene_type:complete